MKKIILILVMIAVMSFMGCEVNRMPLTTDEFITKMSDEGFTVEDVSTQFEEGAVEGVFIAYNEYYQIEFYIVPSDDQAKSAFIENKSAFENVETKTSSNGELNVGNYSSYNRTTDELFMMVSRTENTFVYVVAEKDYKDEIKDFIDMLGY